jgi:quinol monooxygenase YgiN
VKVKHLRFAGNLVASACLVSISGGGLLAAAPAVAQESSMQKTSREKSATTNMVANTAEKSATENLPVEIVTHVDAMPPFTEKTIKALREYRKNTLKESGNKRIDILQQDSRPNHFSIVEEWNNQKSFNEHESAPHTRQFRLDMQEALGAPFDERPHHFIAP